MPKVGSVWKFMEFFKLTALVSQHTIRKMIKYSMVCKLIQVISII